MPASVRRLFGSACARAGSSVPAGRASRKASAAEASGLVEPVGGVLGAAFAIGCWFLGDRAATIARWVLIVPILVPPVVQSLGFYRFWVTLGLIDTWTGVILAHTLLALPYVSISVFAAAPYSSRRISPSISTVTKLEAVTSSKRRP